MTWQHIAANIVVPHGTDIAVFTTSTTDVITTLSNTLHLGTLAMKGQFITIMADGGDVYCYFRSTGDDAAAPGTVTRTSVTGATRCWKILDGQERHFRIQKSADGVGTFRTRLHHVCTAAGKKIRVYVSSAIGSDGIPR